ncbi:MAG TPA: N-acetylmuramoyl-L-alanine amidase [Kofleriaceae bacterium]|nr:N-acetylmuramoyl-L-alanine amidase [Kofleriaceae bacterium]
MSNIWITGKPFPIETRVISWHDAGGFDAHLNRCTTHPRPFRPCPGGIYPFSEHVSRRTYRYLKRPAMRGEWTLAAAQGVIKQCVLHHDGCASSEMCFNVLHNERGLSCHFLLDNDGTLYQTLDLGYMAFHAAGFNAESIGVEISNRGDAKQHPNAYRGGRDPITCRVQNHIYLAYRFTEPQLAALRALGRALARALPNLPIDYPQDSPGHQAWAAIDSARSYRGYLGHYHTTTRKWDPGPLDFKAFCESIRGRRSFPVAVKGEWAVPDDTEKLRAAADVLYDKNEQNGGGYFPVGPFGTSKLWHGGAHIPADRNAPVRAAFAGQVVAARMGGSSAVGSTNFVLLRHDLTVGKATVRFFSLYFHLENDLSADADEAPQWMASPAWQSEKAAGRIVLLQEPVEAGQQIGRVGMAGPESHSHAQIHFEIFSATEIAGAIQAGLWKVVDGTPGGRFAADQEILASIDDAPADGKFSAKELAEFYTGNPDRRLVRYFATLHVSEWTQRPSWQQSLSHAPDFRDYDPKALAELVADQIDPSLWWTDAVARHAALPKDGVVYHYHPVTFVKFVNQKLLEANALAADGLGAFSASQASATPEGVVDDLGDVSGESFLDPDELEQQDFGRDLTLEDLAAGFPE